MIIVQIIGGLGNQMFQYAAGRALSERLRRPLRLDVSGFANYQLHNGFELSRIFSGEMEMTSPADLQQVLGWRSNPLVKRLLERPEIAALRGDQYVVEPHFQYWAGINDVPGDVYLSGYWQTEKYFKSIEATLRNDFDFKLSISENNKKIYDEISRGNTVSLHVRRGDYAKNPKTLAKHGMCSLDYYRSAIQYIAEQVDSPRFLIFSDDIAWVRENLEIKFPSVYVDGNHGSESYNDMRLMSLCQHNIIANSSFSWWGAWLNPNPKKIVVAPRKWFCNSNNLVEDLYPDGWTAL